MKIDLIKRAKEDVIVGEVKKSSKGHHAAKMPKRIFDPKYNLYCLVIN